ncbi:MAG TPA: pyridoxamine 5'-phosphate oxidase family protein [Acidobacteriota bacterium]|nr:pyridoxamine 5'-phosphate oxidase family protein [Acidobacteriota bacterium]
MQIKNPYHKGERKVQQLTGEGAQAERNGGVISDQIMAGALGFIEQQSLAAAATLDEAGYPWASLLLGPAGFISAPAPGQVRIDLSAGPLARDDAFFANLESDPRMGLLIIDLSTRRRLRANGRLKRLSARKLEMEVEEAYPNCPKYIERRRFKLGEPAAPPTNWRTGSRLGEPSKELIARSDTFFVASAYPGGGLDVSHRGGPRGFVEVMGDGRLRVPDYSGNSLFNTLGNLVEHPKAGLAFVDFEESSILQLIGRARVDFRAQDPQNRSGGTGRFWDFHVERWLKRSLPRRVEWEFLDSSPFNQRIAARTAAR